MAYQYFFDRLPFEQDMFAHLLGNVARANLEAGERFAQSRAAVRKAVDDAISVELSLLLPRLDKLSLLQTLSAMPEGLRHPAFGPAWFKVKDAAAYQSSVMSLPGDIEPGIVMAALGVPSAPLLPSCTESFADPTLDIDLLIDAASKHEEFVVGFEPARTDFYYLVSASVRSLRRCLKSEPRFEPIRHIIPMSSMPLPLAPTGTWGVHPKKSTDRIATIAHADNPGAGLTTIFIGGWMEDGVPQDTFPTCQPMPMRILEYIMRHGALAFSLMKLGD